MSDFDRHLLVCDPLPVAAGAIENWGGTVQSLAHVILDDRHRSAWEMGSVLIQIMLDGRLGTEGFFAQVAALVASARGNAWGVNDLFGCVCAMCAAVHVLGNHRLTAKALRRDSIAVVLWSALSFQRELSKPRLEDVRTAVLQRARRTGLELARRQWTRSTTASDARVEEQNRALKRNASLDRDEIEVLRWTLADESSLLERSFADVGSAATVAVSRGLEFGLLLQRFPAFEHYELTSRDVPAGLKTDLAGLVDAIGEDRNALAAPFENASVIDACPGAFPLLTALQRGPTGHADGAVDRSMADWCGRALLESAIVRLSERNREGS